jgi:3-phenylpropionate/cinnamic acid dioxygenase small subunit
VSELDQRAVADRLAIQDLIARYAILIDGQRFEELDELFTADARIDFSTFNGPVGSVAEIKEFLSSSLPFFTRTQHMMGLPMIEITGDTAHARTSCNNPMISTKRDGSTSVWLIGLWYDDDLVRTDNGWRFSARNQIRCYTLTGLVDTPMGA